MSNGDCPVGSENKAKIEGLDKDVSEVLAWIRRLEDKVDKVLDAAMKRPGWAVLTIITVLSSACVALLMALLNHLNGS